MKKSIAWILALTLSLTALAGCGKSEPEKKTPEVVAGKETADKEKPAEPEESPYGDTGGLTLPLVSEKTTVTWMLQSGVQDLNNKDVIKEIERRTGITLEILSTPGASYADKLQITLASGSLPDIVSGIPSSEVNKLGGQGAFVPINEYLGQLPNFRSLYVDNDENNWVMKSFTDDQGKIYTWPVYGLSRDVNHGFMYRKDVFDANGIEEWTDVDGFYQALKKLKEVYPDSTPYVSKTQEAIFKDWAYGWGIGGTSYPSYYDEAASTWKLATIQPEFKEMLDFIKKLYSEGLIDPEFITDTAASWTAKMTTENNAFVTFDWIGRLDMFYEQVKEAMPEYDLRYANPVGPTGNIRSLSKISDFGLVVSKGKNAEAALKLLDYLASPSGSELVTLGIEGDHYVMDGNGKVTYPNITGVEKIEITTLEEEYGAWVESMYVNVDPRSTYFNFTEKEQEAQDKMNSKKSFEALDPILKFTDDEVSIISELTASLDKSGVEFAVQYVLDKNYGDAKWDEWLANAEKLGAAKLEENYNAAQARFNAN